MTTSQNFRVGKVTVYLRGQVWYLRYHEYGKRHQVRASDDKKAARQLASQVNAQLETGAPAATSDLPPRFIPTTMLIQGCVPWVEEPGVAQRSQALQRATPPVLVADSPTNCAA